jgi:hypothetical protein
VVLDVVVEVVEDVVVEVYVFMYPGLIDPFNPQVLLKDHPNISYQLKCHHNLSVLVL